MFVQTKKSPLAKILVFVRWIYSCAKKFRRAKEVAFLGGVCAGIAYQAERPLWVIRMAWFISLMLLSKITLSLYLLLWVFVPQWQHDPEDFGKITDSD